MSYGIALIIMGFLLLFGFNIFVLGYQGILLLIGAFLLVLYIQKGANKQYGNVVFLIPAAILIMQGVCRYLPRAYYHSTLAVGVAFLFIYFIHTRYFSEVSVASRVWPLIPAAILIFESTQRIPVLREARKQVFGLVFILIGGVIIYYYKSKPTSS